MVLGQYSRAVGILPTRQDAESALNELKDSGFSLKKIGVMAKDSDCDGKLGKADRSDRLAAQAQEGATMGAVTGTARKGLGGLLLGFGTLAISGVGPAIAGGTQATDLCNILDGRAIGGFADGWVGLLSGIGIPEERSSVYIHRVSQGGYLVMVEGTAEEIAQAESILRNWGIQEWEIYNAPNTDNAPDTDSANTDNSTIKATERQISAGTHQQDSPIEV